MSASQRQRSRSQPPLVSVILPTYNVERYVAEAVRSVLDQTYPHFELIIRDDGSEDATYEELLRFDDERIVLLEERRHVGGAAARNEAMARARGRYISVLDSDDAMAPRLLEEGVKLLEAGPDIGMVGCTLWQMDKSGRNLQERTPPPKDPDRIQVRSAGGYTAIHHPGLMVRAEAVRTIGGYRECIPHGFDLDFHLRLLEVVDATNLWERLYFYRSHEQQMSVARLDSQTAWARRGWEAMKRRRLSGHDELEPAHPERGVLHLEGRSRQRIARLYCLWAEGVSRGRWVEDRALARRYRARARAYAPRDPRTVLRALGLRAAYARARRR
ncbi:MAG: glycosyltransferase family 2 protein, partial [Candidatus Brocadiia bacterium]